MKKFIYALIAVALGSASCKKLLDTAPTDFIAPKNYFLNEVDVQTALAGVYDVLGKTGTYGRTLYFENDMSDEGFNALSSQTIDLSLNNYDPSNSKVNTLWDLLYDGINRANMFLANIEKPELQMDAAAKKVAKGEVLFLRAYYYFLLVSNWGDVPLRLAPAASANDVHLKRTPAKDIYNIITRDMEAAAELVNPITMYGYNSRITKSVAWGILARVNLKMAGYPLNDHSRYAEARKWALKVMEPENEHQLNPDYAQIFINHSQDKYDRKECIWEVEFNKLATGGQEEEGSVGAINGIGNSDRDFGYSYGAVHVTERYYNAFEEKDLRRDWTINNFYYATVGGVRNTKLPYSPAQIYNRCNAKWRREYETATPKNVNTTPINFPILRFSDVLLMFAEAENEVNGPTPEAYDAINRVRRRGYGLLLPNPPDPTVVADLPAGLDREDFRLAIQKERSLELGFEGLRRFDLIRWGRYIPVMKDLANEIRTTAPSAYRYASRSADNLEERHLLLPIPSREMALNKEITQNPGW